MQPVEVRRLRRAGPARQARVEEAPLRLVGGGGLGSDRGELVGAVAGPQEPARDRPPARLVLVVVAGEGRPQPAPQGQPLRRLVGEPREGRGLQRVHAVVVVQPLHEAEDRLLLLELPQRAARRVEVEPREERQPLRQGALRLALQPDRAVGVLLQRVARQEVEAEVHLGVARVRAQRAVPAARRHRHLRRQEDVPGVPERLGVWVRAAQRVVAEGVLPAHEARRLLLQMVRGQPQRRLPERRRAVGLELQGARLRAVAAIREPGEPAACAAVPALQEPGVAVEAAGGEADASVLGARRGRQRVDRAVQRVRSVDDLAWAPHDLDPLGEGQGQVEEAVHVRETRRPQRHAVREVEEAARPRPARQDGRADRDQALPPRAWLHEDACRPVQEFRGRAGADELSLFPRQDGDRGGHVPQRGLAALRGDDDRVGARGLEGGEEEGEHRAAASP